MVTVIQSYEHIMQILEADVDSVSRVDTLGNIFVQKLVFPFVKMVVALHYYLNL